jgi:histidyl-tRNA synthetase
VGLERLALLMPRREGERRCDVFLAPLAEGALDPALLLQRDLRDAGVPAMLDPEGRSFKSRMKQANKLGARFVAILGEDEMKRGVWTVRDMARSEQEDVPEGRILDHLKEKTNG